MNNSCKGEEQNYSGAVKKHSGKTVEIINTVEFGYKRIPDLRGKYHVLGFFPKTRDK